MLARIIAVLDLILWSVTFWVWYQVLTNWATEDRPAPRWWVSVNVAAAYFTLDAVGTFTSLFSLFLLTTDVTDVLDRLWGLWCGG